MEILVRDNGRFVKSHGFWKGKKRGEMKWLKKHQFKKDEPTWNKGLKGWNLAEKNPNWQGGKTAIHERIRKTLAYEEWRKAVFERDNYTCQHCNRVGGYLHADHIKPFAYFPELRLAINNGRTLCIECHRKTDTYGKGALKYGQA